MEATSEQELRKMLEDGTISEEEYRQLKESMEKQKSRQPSSSKKLSNGELALRKKLLIYGLTTSVIGLPAGLLLHLPLVWGLSIAGIIISLYKMKRHGIIK